MTLTNTDVARALREIALFLEMENVPFKPRSYEKAAQSIATCDEPCSAMLARGGVKALGFTIPQSVLVRANEVIQ